MSKAGKRLDIWPESISSGGGDTITTQRRVPENLPRGAKLQLGVLVGAKRERVEFSFSQILRSDA